MRQQTSRTKFLNSTIVNAFLTVDPRKDFADYERSAIPVPGGREIGPVIGELQIAGKETGFFKVQADVSDDHPKNFFSSDHNNRELLALGITCVPDGNGVLHTILPRHMERGTWGYQFIRGIHAGYYDRFFSKGTQANIDQFSGCTPEVEGWLKSHGVTDVYMGGLVERICLGTTAINLVYKGFRVHLVTEAMRDKAVPGWENVIDIMSKLKAITRISKADLLAKMNGA